MIHFQGFTKNMRKIAVFALLAFGAVPAHAGQVEIPCTTGYDNPDSFMSLIDQKHFAFFGGGGGPSLDRKYSNFLGFEKKFSYQGSGYRYPQEYGICKLMTH